MDRYKILFDRLKKDYPRLQVKIRSQTWLGIVFRILSFFTRKDYSNFTTTLGSTLYVEDHWNELSSDRRYAALRHEIMHVRQFHRWPLGRWAWPLNHLIMALAYLLLLPVFWTMRAHFEREGYTQTLLVRCELQGEHFSDLQMEANARWMVEMFCTSAYLWMWTRRKTYDWAMETQRKINEGTIINDRDRV